MRAYRFVDLEVPQPVEPPAAVRLGSTSTLDFQLGADVPRWPRDKAAVKQWPISQSQRDAYWELRLPAPSQRVLPPRLPVQHVAGIRPDARPGVAVAADAECRTTSSSGAGTMATGW